MASMALWPNVKPIVRNRQKNIVVMGVRVRRIPPVYMTQKKRAKRFVIPTIYRHLVVIVVLVNMALCHLITIVLFTEEVFHVLNGPTKVATCRSLPMART